jgi:hypothetical protein
MNTMPKDTSLTEAQKKRISERAKAMDVMKEMVERDDRSIMGRVDQRSDPFATIRPSRVTAKTVASNMKDMSAQLGRVVKQEEAEALRQTMKAEGVKFGDLVTRLEKVHISDKKVGSRRKRKSRGGRKKRSTRRKL